MTRKHSRILWRVAICLVAVATISSISFSKDIDLEEIIRGHIESMGGPGKIEGVKVRGIGGTSLVDFIQGGTGKIQGTGMFLSRKDRLGIIMRFGATEYPGEHFAYDGKKVMVNQISPGQKSPLADFIYRYGAIVKEGILGGALSLNWPLLDANKIKSRLKYKGIEKVDGVELYEIEYGYSDRKLNDMKTKLYFEPGTFRHVQTEYRMRISGEMGLQADAVVRKSGIPSSDNLSGGGELRAGSIQDIVPDSHYVLTEKFSDFKATTDGLTLPHQYVLEYSLQGQGSSFMASWTILAGQFMHTGQIDESFFKADE